MYMNHVGGRRLMRRAGMGIGLLLLLVTGGPHALSQQANGPANQEGLTMTELLKLQGKILGEGSNTRGAGKYKVASFRVEELMLPRAMEVNLRGQKVQATRAFRLTVTGGPFAVRALPPVIWIDDTPVGYGVENEVLNAITAITFDPELIREGATLYLSYGDKEDKTGRVAVPEKLKLGGANGGAK